MSTGPFLLLRFPGVPQIAVDGTEHDRLEWVSYAEAAPDVHGLERRAGA
jgi:hypothetical protein